MTAEYVGLVSVTGLAVTTGGQFDGLTVTGALKPGWGTAETRTATLVPGPPPAVLGVTLRLKFDWAAARVTDAEACSPPAAVAVIVTV